MADDRKVELNHSTVGAVPELNPSDSTAASHPADEEAGKSSYSLWLQLQYQQQLSALQSTVSAAAAHEASQSTQRGPYLSRVSPFPAAHAAIPPSADCSDLYSQSASLYNHLQEQASSLPPEWSSPSLSSAESAGIPTPSQALPEEALGRPPNNMGAQGENRDFYAKLHVMYAAEQERQQLLVAARMHAFAAGIGGSQAETGYGPGPPFLRDPAAGIGRAPVQCDGETCHTYTLTHRYTISPCIAAFTRYSTVSVVTGGTMYIWGWAGYTGFSVMLECCCRIICL